MATTSRQSSREIAEAIRAIESDITDREKRISRRESARTRATNNGDHAKAARIGAEIADEQTVLDAARENLIAHKAVKEEVQAEERAAYEAAREARQVKVEQFASDMLAEYQAGALEDRFGKIDADIQNLTIRANGASYVEVGMVVTRIVGAMPKHDYPGREETRHYQATVYLPEPKEMAGAFSHRNRSEVNWAAYGSTDLDETACFGQILRIASAIGAWADRMLGEVE